MKRLNYILLFVLFFFTLFTQQKAVSEESTYSSRDKNVQKFYYYKSSQKKQSPTVIVHQWIYGYQHQENSLAKQTIDKDLNYTFPDFSGSNNNEKGCTSKYVIRDFDKGNDWALKGLNDDKRGIYNIGVSGGEYASLALYMKSRHKINML